MEWIEHTDKIVVLLGVLGAGVAWVWLQIRNSKKESDERDAETAVREASYVTKIEARNEQLLIENGTLHQQLLRARLDGVAAGYPPVEVLKNVIEACPKHMWAKRRIGERQYVYVAVSFPFASLYFGGSPKMMMGKSPADFMDEESLEAVLKINEVCFVTQSPAALHERIKSVVTGVDGVLDGCKFFVRLSDGFDYVIGIADHLPVSTKPSSRKT